MKSSSAKTVAKISRAARFAKINAANQARAQQVADRLLGRKKRLFAGPDAFFGGTEMRMPIQYSLGAFCTNPRTSFIISGMEGI